MAPGIKKYAVKTIIKLTRQIKASYAHTKASTELDNIKTLKLVYFRAR